MSNDLIIRQAAIDVLEERIHANGYSNTALVSELNRSIGYLMKLPSAQPGIDGHVVHAKFVIGDDGFVRCSACNKTIRYPLVSFSDIEYCPHCGVKMEANNE